MTPFEKTAYIEIQLWACERGEINAIICPFCGEVNAKGSSMCCTPLVKACVAVLSERWLTPEREEFVFHRTNQGRREYAAVVFHPSLKNSEQ
jgi:hypothetical protein